MYFVLSSLYDTPIIKITFEIELGMSIYITAKRWRSHSKVYERINFDKKRLVVLTG